MIYHNGDHGTSDGKGDQPSEDYNNDVTGGNGVTPNDGYKFTGRYTYIIKDKGGTVIGTGETDDPTSLKVTGNIEFTPIYEKLPWAQWIDPATGRTIKVPTSFLDEGVEPPAPQNPTRDGYKFVGWDREVDAEGNVTYKAKGEKLPEPAPAPDPTPKPSNVPATGDVTPLAGIALLGIAGAAAAAAGFVARRRQD